MDADRMRQEALDECNRPEEITLAAAAVADALRRGVAAEVALAPGNGTRYRYLFAGADALVGHASAGEYLDSAACNDGAVWIVRLDDNKSAAYPVALLGRTDPPAPYYLAEKFFDGRLTFDVFILEALLREIGRRTQLQEAR